MSGQASAKVLMTATELGGATASWGPPWSSSSCGQHIGSGTGGRWRTWWRSSAVLAGRKRSVPRLPRARGQPTSGASTASIRIAGWGALTTHSRINEVYVGTYATRLLPIPWAEPALGFLLCSSSVIWLAESQTQGLCLACREGPKWGSGNTHGSLISRMCGRTKFTSTSPLPYWKFNLFMYFQVALLITQMTVY